MRGVLVELVALLTDDWAVRWHRARRDWHDDGLAVALERRRERIARWTARL